MLFRSRDRTLSLPDDPEVREEFLSTRLVETAPGVVKLSNPRGAHDDIVTAVGMVVADLSERPDLGGARATVPHGTIARRATGGSVREAGQLRPPRVRGLPGLGGRRVSPYGPEGATIPGRDASGRGWGR